MRFGIAGGLTVWAMGVVALRAETELYNLDFTPPEKGNYETIFGEPEIEPTVGPFQNAMVLEGFAGYEQIRLEVGGVGRQYGIQFDVMVHELLDSEYSFAIHLDYDLDLAEFRSINFHGGDNHIYTFSPGSSFSGAPVDFFNDEPYHFGINLDFDAKEWSLDIDGTQTFIGGITGENLESIRFTMSPRVGGASDDPSVYGAIDNVVVSVVPEPSATMIATGGAAVIMLIRRRQGVFTRQLCSQFVSAQRSLS